LILIPNFVLNICGLISLRPYFPVFKFVAVFGGLYLVLSFLYGIYLQRDYSQQYYPDPVTAVVADQVSWALNTLGRQSSMLNSVGHPSVRLFVGSMVVYRVIEGCNAVSVMILFASFVLAFAKAWKKTVLFLLLGIVIIYLMNLVRLIILAFIYADYRVYASFAHEILFPAIIYGTVVLLWLYWIKAPKTR
jgi:exosortase family protein XrtF